MKQTNFFGQANGRFLSTNEDPLYGAAFYLMAVQLVDINGDYTDWITLNELSFNGYGENDLLPVGKNLNDWKKMKKKISDDYCDGINYLAKGNITPFKQVASLKIRYLGEPKKISHIFHYYPPRNP